MKSSLATLLSTLTALTLPLAFGQVPPLSVFATGPAASAGLQAQGIQLAPSGDEIYIINTNGLVLRVPRTGGLAMLEARIPIPPDTTCPSTQPCVSLRDGVFLPATFGSKAGQLLVIGGRALTSTPAYASTVDAAFAVTPYATQPASLWSAAVVAEGFGQYRGGVLIANQGAGLITQGLRTGTLDYFAPDGSKELVTTMMLLDVPYGAALAPKNFGDIGGNLVVSDARTGRIANVNPRGVERLFTTLPNVAGLRQVAFAPQGWGRYSGMLFVAAVTGEVLVVDRKGGVAGRIGGLLAPRALRFLEIGGQPSLLIGDTDATRRAIYRAGPEHIERVR